jgi:hypothetical protein
MLEITFPDTLPDKCKEYGVHQLFKILCIYLLKNDISRMSLIDLCCDLAPVTRHMWFKQSTYVDINPDISNQKLPNFVCTDVLSNHAIFNKKYDVATCFDGIEHLSKENGIRLLERMKNLATHNIIFTPLGEFCVQGGDDPYYHHSGWLPEEFQDYVTIVFPKFHATALNIGAFIAYRNWNVEVNKEEERVVKFLKEMNIGPFFVNK